MRILIIVASLLFVAAKGRAEDFGVFVRHLRAESGRSTATPQTLPLPGYPPDLLAAGIEGYATIRFLVGVDGSVSRADAVAASQREFVVTATEAVLKWKFVSGTATATALAPVWMQCTLVFRTREEDYFPAFAAGFASTSLSGREVIRLASELARKEGIDVDQYAGFSRADIFLTDAGHQLRWGVTWNRAGAYGDYYRVWINDSTREAKSEGKEKPNEAPEPTPTSVTPPAAQEPRRP